MQSLPLSHAAPVDGRRTLAGIGAPAGASGALAVLLALPAAILGQALDIRPELMVHVFLGVGTLLVAWSAFQFGLPRWLTGVGVAAATGLGIIFLLQGLTELTMSESLRTITYGVLGQWPEGVLGDLVVAWFFALAMLVTRGRTRVFGLVILPAVLAFSVVRWLPGLTVAEAIPTVLPLLLAFAWFLFASVQEQRR